jgi:hypothetical protein
MVGRKYTIKVTSNSFLMDNWKIPNLMDSEDSTKTEKSYMRDNSRIIALMDGASLLSMQESLEMDFMMVMGFIKNSKIKIGR